MRAQKNHSIHTIVPKRAPFSGPSRGGERWLQLRGTGIAPEGATRFLWLALESEKQGRDPPQHSRASGPFFPFPLPWLEASEPSSLSELRKHHPTDPMKSLGGGLRGEGESSTRKLLTSTAHPVGGSLSLSLSLSLSPFFLMSTIETLQVWCSRQRRESKRFLEGRHPKCMVSNHMSVATSTSKNQAMPKLVMSPWRLPTEPRVVQHHVRGGELDRRKSLRPSWSLENPPSLRCGRGHAGAPSPPPPPRLGFPFLLDPAHGSRGPVGGVATGSTMQFDRSPFLPRSVHGNTWSSLSPSTTHADPISACSPSPCDRPFCLSLCLSPGPGRRPLADHLSDTLIKCLEPLVAYIPTIVG